MAEGDAALADSGCSAHHLVAANSSRGGAPRREQRIRRSGVLEGDRTHLGVGGGELSTDSTTPQRIEQSVGAQPQIDPVAPQENRLTARTSSNGTCALGSTVDSTRFRVLAFG